MPGQVARRSRLLAGQATLVSLLYLLPSLIVFAVFVFYPLFKSFYLSLYATNPFVLSTFVYVPLKQYNIILHSQTYLDSLIVTLLYTLYTVPLGVLVALALAVLANAQVRGIAVFRTLFALPVGVSMAAAAL